MSVRKISTTFAMKLETIGTMATAIKAIPTLYGEEARHFGEAALQAELSYEPKVQKPLSVRRRRARQLLSQAGLIQGE